MKLIEKLPDYASIDMTTFTTGDEIGTRVALSRPSGTVLFVVANFINTSTISGGTTSDIACYISHSVTASTGNRSQLFCGIPQTTGNPLTRMLYLSNGQISPIVSWWGISQVKTGAFSDYWTATLTHDRTAGTVQVDLLLFGE